MALFTGVLHFSGKMSSRKSMKRSQLNDESGQSAKKLNSKDPMATTTDSADNDSINYIETLPLPKEILMAITQLIPKAQWPALERVNRQFQEAVYAAWATVNHIDFDADFVLDQAALRKDSVEVLHKLLEKLTRLAPNITSLVGFSVFSNRPSGDVWIGGNTMDLLAKFGCLEILDFNNVNTDYINLARFLTMTQSRSHLKAVTLGNQTLEQPVMLFGRVWSPQHHCTPFCTAISNRADLLPVQLKAFRLGDFFMAATDFITHFDFTNLEELCLSGALVKREILISLVNRCHKLRRLEFMLTIAAWNKELGDGPNLTIDMQLLQAIAASPSENLTALKIE